jgi:hypothetical protein
MDLKLGNQLTSCDVYLGGAYLGNLKDLKLTQSVDIGSGTVDSGFDIASVQGESLSFEANFSRKEFYKAFYPEKERQIWNKMLHAKSKRQKMKQIKRYYKLKYGG